jgi:hypothetical protein
MVGKRFGPGYRMLLYLIGKISMSMRAKRKERKQIVSG